MALDTPQRRSTGERQVEVESRDHLGRQILEVVALQLGQRHWSVDVVECRHPARSLLNKPRHFDALGDVRANEDSVRGADLIRPMLQLFDGAVELEPAIVRISDISVVAVPGNVAFEEQDLVAARGEGLQKRAKSGRMTIAPR